MFLRTRLVDRHRIGRQLDRPQRGVGNVVARPTDKMTGGPYLIARPLLVGGQITAVVEKAAAITDRERFRMRRIDLSVAFWCEASQLYAPLVHRVRVDAHGRKNAQLRVLDVTVLSLLG